MELMFIYGTIFIIMNKLGFLKKLMDHQEMEIPIQILLQKMLLNLVDVEEIYVYQKLVLLTSIGQKEKEM